jgi:hypothetical protein
MKGRAWSAEHRAAALEASRATHQAKAAERRHQRRSAGALARWERMSEEERVDQLQRLHAGRMAAAGL